MNKNELKAILKSKIGISGSGIRGGSIGPMTCTNAHLEHNDKVEERVLECLQAHGFWKSDGVIKNGELGFKLIWELKSTYKGEKARLYDPGYKTFWAKILWM